MTDKEFKRLSRSQLIDIIYQFQLQVDKLTEQNKELEKALADKRLRMEKAGNLAQAALVINNCFESAQNAADQYLFEIQQMYEKAKRECGVNTEPDKTEADTDTKEENAEATGERDV